MLEISFFWSDIHSQILTFNSRQWCLLVWPAAKGEMHFDLLMGLFKIIADFKIFSDDVGTLLLRV